MKKLLAILTSCMLVTPAFAAEAEDANTYYAEFETAEGIESIGMAAGYDENNRLVAASPCDIVIGDEVCSTEFSMDLAEGSIRIYIPETGTIIKDFITLENPGENPENPGEEPGTEEPGTDDPGTQEPDIPDSDAVSRYPTALDAATAFMVVKDVETTVEDTDIKTVLNVYFRGEEIELVLDDDLVIDSASLMYADLAGEPLTSLSEGDVIYCSANMSGKILSVELICRAPQDDIIMQEEDYGVNFEDIYSLGSVVTEENPVPISVYGAANDNGYRYAFGVVKEKQNGYMVLCNKAGLAENDIEIELTDDTVVYVYDNDENRDKLYIGTTVDIIESEFDGESLDEEGNVIEWNDELSHNYVLVRTSDGVALDVVVYLNYN